MREWRFARHPDLMGQAAEASRAGLRTRRERIIASARPILHTSLAAAVAWFVATQVLDHRAAFFAPISAVITLGLTVGQRRRRAVEIAVGVAVGIAIADALVAGIGTGPWQIGVVTGLAMAGATLVGGGPLLASQPGASADEIERSRAPRARRGDRRLARGEAGQRRPRRDQQPLCGPHRGPDTAGRRGPAARRRTRARPRLRSWCERRVREKVTNYAKEDGAMPPISRGFRGRRRLDVDAARLPPGQYVTHDFPVLSAGPTPQTSRDDWSLTVAGAVGEGRSWSWEELTALPSESVTVDIHCVTKWSKFDTSWTGVSLDRLLEGTEPWGRFVVAWCDGGYTTNLPLADVTNGKAWIAYEFGGEPLEPQHGGPARLLVPHLYFWKSAKWVRGLNLSDEDEPGFWESYGYHNYGDPWKEQRYWSD